MLDELEYTEFNGGGHFFFFQQEKIFFGKFGPQNQNTSLSWSFSVFSTGNSLFGQIWSKKSKLSV